MSRNLIPVIGSTLLALKRRNSCLLASVPLFAFACCGFAIAEPAFSNPIGRIARLFNPDLVKMEDRVEFLNRQLISLATHKEQALEFGIGYRGARLAPTDPLPSMTVDLGSDYPIESLFLVPIQSGVSDRGSLFPKGSRIELSSSPDFSEFRVLFDSGDNSFPETGGKPGVSREFSGWFGGVQMRIGSLRWIAGASS